MLKINQLLARFKNVKNNEKFKKEQIVDVLTKNNIPIKINQITISKNTIFIKTPPIIKTELIIKKQILIDQIKKIHSLENITNVI